MMPFLSKLFKLYFDSIGISIFFRRLPSNFLGRVNRIEQDNKKNSY